MKIKKGLVSFFAMTAVVGTMSMSNHMALANNYKDSTYCFTYHGDGSDLTTRARKKTDNTYTYVRSMDDSEATLSVMAAAKKGIIEGEYGNPFNFSYSTKVYSIKVGNRKYFPNLAHKKGYSTTYLCLASKDHKEHYFHIKWSPDNCSGYK